MKKGKNLLSWRFSAGKFGEEIQSQEKGDKPKSYSNCSSNRQFVKVNHKLSSSSSSLNEMYKHNIAKNISTVKAEAVFAATASKINPAEIFTDKEDKTRRWKGLMSNDIHITIEELENLVNVYAIIKFDWWVVN